MRNLRNLLKNKQSLFFKMKFFKMKIPFNNLRPNTPKSTQIKKSINKVLDSGHYILDREVEAFEKEFAQYLGIKHCIGVGNGLEAIQIVLMVLGVGPDDEIITTPLSAVATTLAIIAVGAKPVFADTNEKGLIDPNLIESLITKRTKAVLPVHLYGQACDIQTIKRICQKHKLFLVEDAAQAHGSTFNRKKLGTFGDINCFSFYPTKNLGAFGDAGTIVTNNKKYAQVCREIRDYGQKSKYFHTRYGLNSRLDELQATVLRVKLKYLDKENEKRKALAKRYSQNLSKISQLKIVTPYSMGSNFHLFVIRTSKRNNFQKFLKKNGVETLIHFPRIIPDQPFLKKAYKTKLPVAEMLVKQVLSLPCYPSMNLKKVDYVCQVIKEFFKV